MGLLDIWF